VRIGGTLYGDALGGPGSGADTYLGMVRANIDTIVEGLTETPPS
jgi:manganese/zinc/iron transport system substrate-binding protein